MSLPNPIIISLDGNIGGGKSTMLQHMRNTFPEWNFIDEPVDSWMTLKDENGKNLLELFYQDKTRWSYTLQNCAFITRHKKVKDAVEDWKKRCLTDPTQAKNNVFITERSVATDRYVFAEMLRDAGDLNPLEWELYLSWYNVFAELNPINAVIEVTTPFGICKDRIAIRGRQGEENIPMTYLEALEQQHRKWLDNTSLPLLKITSDISELNKVYDFVVSLK